MTPIEAYRAWHAARPLYAIWRGMKIRCLKPTHHEFHRYGGRGIAMHPAWIGSFRQFEADVTAEIGPRPSGLTIDRIDNDGHYVPGNIRWRTRSEQCRTKTHARGEAQGLAKLTDDSVYAMRRVAALEIFDKQQLGDWWHVGRTTVGHVLARRTWRHVP